MFQWHRSQTNVPSDFEKSHLAWFDLKMEKTGGAVVERIRDFGFLCALLYTGYICYTHVYLLPPNLLHLKQASGCYLCSRKCAFA